MKAKFNVKISTSAIAELEPISSIEMQVFLFLASRMDATNQLFLGGYSRKEFAESIHTSGQYISNAIQALKKKGYLSVIGKGEYKINQSIAKKA